MYIPEEINTSHQHNVQLISPVCYMLGHNVPALGSGRTCLPLISSFEIVSIMSEACYVHILKIITSGKSCYVAKISKNAVKTRLYKTPSPILHCISQLGENKGG